MALCFRTLTAWATRPPTPSPPPTFTQLKKGALLGDFDGLVGNVRAVRAAFSRDEEAVNAHLAAMKLEVQVGDNGAGEGVCWWVRGEAGGGGGFGRAVGGTWFGASLCFRPSLTPFPYWGAGTACVTRGQLLLLAAPGSARHHGSLPGAAGAVPAGSSMPADKQVQPCMMIDDY